MPVRGEEREFGYLRVGAKVQNRDWWGAVEPGVEGARGYEEEKEGGTGDNVGGWGGWGGGEGEWVGEEEGSGVL